MATAHITGAHYLGRQPILDRTRNLTGFELDLRPYSPKQVENVRSAASLLRYAFGELGAESVLGRHKGVINLTPELLLSDAVESMPREQVMLSLGGCDHLTADLLQRCRTLKSSGYSLALEASVLRLPGSEGLVPETQVIKFAATGMNASQLTDTVRALKPLGHRLLASGVETPGLARQCLESGVDFLQGQHFVRPPVEPGRKLDHGQMALMELLGLILSDPDLDEVVEAFKHYPDISLQILRLANSAAVGARSPSTSIRQAVTVLGRNALQRWLQVLMFSTGGVPGVEFPSPLLIQAATRGKLIELLARDLMRADRAQQDRGFLVGMLSLLSAQFGVEIEQLIEGLPLETESRTALLERAGRLGVLLFLVESLELPGFVDMQMALDGIDVVDTEALMSLQVAAMNWANTLDTGASRRSTL